MTTYLLANETIDAYLADLVRRLGDLPEPPEVICAVTTSGLELLKALVRVTARFPDASLSGAVLASLGEDPLRSGQVVVTGISESWVRGRKCLLIDSAIHSGRLMSGCHRKLTELGAGEIVSYALVLKRGSVFVPTFWSLMIQDGDRALFYLSEIPNNRLASSSSSEMQPISLHILDDQRAKCPLVVTGVESLDRITWEDRLYDQLASTSESLTRTYVMDRAGLTIGFLTPHIERRAQCLVVDEVALAPEWQGRKLGGVMVRFACTLARHYDCSKVRLNAIEEKVALYEKLGFSRCFDRQPLKLDGCAYHAMEKLLLRESHDCHDE